MIGDLYCHEGSRCESLKQRPKSNARLRGKLQLGERASVRAPPRRPAAEGMKHAMGFALLAVCPPLDGWKIPVRTSYSTDIHFLARKLASHRVVANARSDWIRRHKTK